MTDPCDELYELCRDAANSSKEGYRKNFKQDELIEICRTSDSAPLEAVKDVHKLLPLVSTLCRNSMFISLKSAGSSCWGVRPRKASLQVQKLNSNEKMIYEIIESTYEEGAWLRMLKNKNRNQGRHQHRKDPQTTGE